MNSFLITYEKGATGVHEIAVNLPPPPFLLVIIRLSHHWSNHE
jgi:hypothetical protein